MSRQALLVVPNADGTQRQVQLDAGTEYTIGRHPVCSITVTQPSVSREHAKICFEHGSFHVKDLDSVNGTYRNNQRIKQSPLQDGDELRLGDLKMAFKEQAAGTSEIPIEAVAPVAEEPRGPVAGTIRPAPTGAAAPRFVGRLPKGAKPSAPGASSPVPQSVMSGPPSTAPAPRAVPVSRGAPAPVVPAPVVPAPVVPAPVAPVAPAPVPAAMASPEAEELRSQAEELRRDLDDRQRRIAQLESEQARNQEQITTLTDRSLRLKEQVNAQQNQLEEYRRERAQLGTELEEAKLKVADLVGAQDASGNRESQLADAVNDLKREVRQKERAHKEIQAQLDLVEYNLKAAREENDNLQLALDDERRKRDALNATLMDLQQVLGEKEGFLEQLQHELSRWKQRAQQAEDRSRDEGGAQLARLSTELEAALKERDEQLRLKASAERELNALREAKSQETAATSRQGMEQINELKRANRDLRQQLEEAKLSGGVGDASLHAALESALAERDAAVAARTQVEVRLRAAEARPAPAPISSRGDEQHRALLTAAVEAFEALNDLASDLRMNIEVSSGHVRELRTLVDTIEPFMAGLSDPSGRKVREAFGETDACLTAESAEETLGYAEASSQKLKAVMRRLREVLVAHGYGS